MKNSTKAIIVSSEAHHSALQTIFNRNHSTGNIFQARTLAADYKRFPETLSRVAKIIRPLLLHPHLEADQSLSQVHPLPEQSSLPDVFLKPSKSRHETPSNFPSFDKGNPLEKSLYPGRIRPGPDLHRSLASLDQSKKAKIHFATPLIGHMRSSTRLAEYTNEKEPLNPVSKVAFRTRTGLLQGRPKPHNQDNFLVVSDFNSTKHQKLLGVFDGHGKDYLGPFGHEVASFVKSNFTWFVERMMMKLVGKREKLRNASEDLANLRSGLKAGISALNQDLMRKMQIDTNFSGCTANVTIVRGNWLLTANIGDSRAIVGRKTGNDWISVDLSRDHKPELPQERRRIENCGGRIEPLRGTFHPDSVTGSFVGPYRVWKKQHAIPGLAMSRSFGDFVASEVGVICEAEISLHECSSMDKFLLIATDGIWEVLTSGEVTFTQCVGLVAGYWERRDIEGACEALVCEAAGRWRKAAVVPGDVVVDDITVILAFLSYSDCK